MTAQALTQSHFDAASLAALRPADLRASARVVHLDLSQVTQIDGALIARINDAYMRATRAHRIFRVTPPDGPVPRAAFLLAAVRGELRWAARSI
jgi:hypothetical protein